MIAYPNPKINLGLIIKGRRDDGYHLLETLYFPVFGSNQDEDILEVVLQDSDECLIRVKGLDVEIRPEENLVYKSWLKFREVFPPAKGAVVNLSKRIPSGAGLGGGSSDAAFMLRMLNSLHGNPFRREQLIEIAAKLGSDVPFFICNKPMFASGTGVELEPYKIRLPYKIVIRQTGFHSPTPEAYKNVNLNDCPPGRDLKTILSKPVKEWKKFLVNDLEKPVFKMFPQIEEEKQNLYREGAVYAAMTGSGSSVFGLFPQTE